MTQEDHTDKARDLWNEVNSFEAYLAKLKPPVVFEIIKEYQGRIEKLEKENASLNNKAKHLAALLLVDMSALVDYQRPDEDVFDCITRLRNELEQSRKWARAWRHSAHEHHFTLDDMKLDYHY